MHRFFRVSRWLSSPFVATIFATALLLFASPHSAWATPPAMVPGEVLVKFKSNASQSDIRAIMDDLGATRIKRFHRIHAEQDRITRYGVLDAVNRYKNHRAIEFIEPNYIVQISVTPSDPQFGQQWSLLNVGQFPGGVPGADIDATLAWDVQTGSPNVIVAIIDSGTDYNHPDLAANIWTNPGEIPGNNLDDDANGFVDDVHGYDFYNFDPNPMDDNGHGTHTAGTVGAVGNNGVGISGVAWNVKLMPLKFLSANGSGPISAAVECVEYATNMGAHILNNSWGGGGFSLALQAAIQDANTAGILFVAAAGNASADLDQITFYPASYTVPNVIAVASTTHADQLSDFSNYGGSTVHLAAPGSSILSTYLGNGYTTFSGTSMAAPHVCGVLALLKSQFPLMPAATMKTVLMNSTDPLPALAGNVITGGRLNAARVLEGLDETAPAPIADVTVVSTFSNRVVLGWTATGDDGAEGTASRYDLRYDDGPITEATFDLATQVNGVPSPGPAGAAEQITAAGLDYSTLYYLAVRAIDEYGNASPISNVVVAMTPGAPQIAFSPPSFTQSLSTGTSATQTLTLSNLSPDGTLDFAVEAAPPPPQGAAQLSMALAKGEPDPRVGDPVLQGSGGPDVFGHVWMDSDQPGGPAFNWVDISGVGVPVPISGDDVTSGPIQMGFSFPYYDNMFNQVRVCTNGFLSFTSSFPDYTNQPLPSQTAPENMIAPFWDDLYFLAGSVAYVHFDGLRFIVQWNNVLHYPGTDGPYTFQAILHRDGTILFQYLSMGSPLTSATVGIQNGLRSDGLTVAFNTAYIHNGLAVRITSVPQWLSVAPPSGTVLGGQSQDLAVRMDAAGLAGGEYDAAVRITSNDPDEPEVLVPVHLHVDPAPDIAVVPASLDFGQVFLGSLELVTLLVANEGVVPLTILGASATPIDYDVDDGTITLAPGQTFEMEVRFAPTRTGSIPGLVTILSDDPDESTVTVPLVGTGLIPPDISVAPSSMSAALLTGLTEIQTLTVNNTGGSNLAVQMGVGYVTQAAGPGPAPASPGAGNSQEATSDAPVDALTGADLPETQILVIQNTSAWGLVMSTFLMDRFGITPTVINSSQIASTDFTPFDLVVTVGDEGSSYYNAISANVAKFEEFLSQGGVVQYQLATQGSNVGIAGGVQMVFGDLEDENRVLLPDHPIVAGLPSIVHGNSANHCTMVGLPPEAQVITETADSHSPTTVEYAYGLGTVVATGMTWEWLYLNGYDAGPMLYQALAYSLSRARPPWLRVSPTSANIPPGGSADFQVTFDAARLFGGGYDGLVRVMSNDPDESLVEVPVHLDVTGAPDIILSDSGFDFGALFLTTSRTDTLRITNDGTDILSVTAIDIDDTDFRVDVSTFDLAPRQGRYVYVTFAPTRTGPIHGTATIHSNDPDEPALTVALDGAGLEPPDIDVSPTSFSEALFTGQTVTRTLAVANVSGSDLEFDIRLDPVLSGAAQPPAAGGEALPSLAPRAWSEYVAEAAADTVPPAPALPELVPLALPVVIQDPAGDGGPVDLVAVRGGVRAGALQIEMEMNAAIVPTNFGGFMSLDVDQNRNTGRPPSFGNPFQDVGVEYEFQFFSLGSGVVYLVDVVHGFFVASLPAQISSNMLRFAAPLAYLGNDDGRIDVTGVIGTSIGPTDWFPNTGHGTFGAVDWLSASPESGTVPAGSTMEVTLTFDSGSLDGGEYDANIVVETNDPDELSVAVPAHLTITGAPLIRVEPAVLSFGSHFLGTSRSLALTVFNVGTDVLDVSSIGSADPDYSVNLTAFSLAPRTSRVVTVRFAPTVAGDHTATLLLTHNAAGSPTAVSLTGTGVVPPVVTATPASIQSTLESGQNQMQLLTVGNAGGSNLTFTLGAEQTATDVAVQEAMDVPRGAEDPRQGPPVAQGMGGPDRFGYRWIDSDQPGGPVFSWVEISGIGTRIPMSALDDNKGPFPIGFAFPFYGNTFSQFRICTHGWISFTSSTIQYVNQPLPSAGAPENLLAAFWEDLNFSGVERAYYHYDGTRFIVQYTAVPRTDGGGPFTFQILLYPNGAIVYQYLSMGSPSNQATIGIQNATRNDGLQIAFNTQYVHSGLAIRISAAPSWLSLSPLSGTVPPAGTAPIEVTTDATGLFPDDYPARILISSNDPVTPQLAVPVSLHVIGIPRLAFSPARLDFDTLWVNEDAARTLRVTNVGTDRLEVSAFTAGFPDFSVTPPTLSLAPLQSATVSVALHGATPGDRSTTLSISSNDPNSPAQVPLSAVVLIPPVLAIEPMSMVAAALPGGQKQKTMRVSNTGGSDLRWSASSPIVAGAGGAPAPAAASEPPPKGDPDPRVGILGSGGPDLAGHVWIDSDHPSGPEFGWIDITTIGTLVPFSPNADDQNLGPFPIGFTFPFYDSDFDQFRVCTNGFISFTSTSTRFFNEPLPSQGGDVPTNLLAVAWDDLFLNPNFGSHVYYHSDGQRLIVQWDNLRAFGPFSPTNFTFQAILTPDGTVVYQYLSLGATAQYTTVGIQNAQGTDGLTVVFNQAYLHPNLAVRISTPPRWLSISPRSGVIPAGQVADLNVMFDAQALAAGDYEADVPFGSNQPDQPYMAPYFLLHVGALAASDVDVDPNTLNLGSNGNWLTARVELPADRDPSDVVPSTVRLLGTVPAEGDALSIGDFNHNQVPDLEFKFDRAAVEAILPEGQSVPVSLIGEIEDTIWFTALDMIRVIRPRLTAPNGGEVVPSGAPITVTWTDPEAVSVDHADLIYSLNNGETWMMLAQGIAGTSYVWTTPVVGTEGALIRVYVYDNQGVLGYDTSDTPFSLLPTTTGVETEAASLPRVFALHQNAPNPFNPQTEIRFDMPAGGRAAMRIYGVDGRLVRDFMLGALPAGRHRLRWDGKDGVGREVGTGVYFYRLEVAGAQRFEASRRMMLVK